MLEKWSINRLSEESGKDRRAVKKILSNVEPCGIEVNGTELYFLKDFVAAIENAEEKNEKTADYWQEQTRLTRAKADIAEVERARIRNEVIETETVFRTWENVGVSIRRTILTSNLSQEEKDSILNELQSLKIEDYLEQREFDQGTPTEISQPV